MIDIESLESDAFHYLHTTPDFARKVIELCTEMEKARDYQAALEKIIDDDKLIIDGLLKDYKLFEKVAIAAKRYAEGFGTREEFETAWSEVERRLLRVVA